MGGGARAARGFALLSLAGEAVEDFEEGSLGTGDAVLTGMDFSVFDSEGGVGAVARAARGAAAGGTEFLLFGAAGLFASELAFRLRAESGGLALPGALGLLAERSAVGFGGSAGGTADSGTAHGFASGAVFHFAHFLRATDGADGFFAVDFAFGALRGLAVHLALGASAHGVALGGADGVVAQPFALGVAGGCHGGNGDKSKKSNDLHFSEGRWEWNG